MSKIARKTQKIFASTSGANQIAQFGSLAASAPAFTTDPAVIQGLANYLEGWFGAILGSNSPAIEDMNALFYLFAYQLAYLFQSGVAEWDASTVYYIGSLAQDGSGNVYQSITNANTGNALTNTTYWRTFPNATTTVLTTTGDTSASGLTITNLASTAGLLPGMVCGGSMFQSDTVILSVSGTTATISRVATTTQTGGAMTFSHNVATGITSQSQLDELDAAISSVIDGYPTFNSTNGWNFLINGGPNNEGIMTILFSGSPNFGFSLHTGGGGGLFPVFNSSHNCAFKVAGTVAANMRSADNSFEFPNGAYLGSLSGNAPLMKTERFTGTLAASGNVNLTVTATSVLGMIGMTTHSGAANTVAPIGNYVAGNTTGCYFDVRTISGTTQGALLRNGDAGNSNNYDVTIFYF